LEGKKTPCNYIKMEILSEKYGWTPKQIKELDDDDIKMYLRIISEKNFLQMRELKKLKNKN